MIFGIINDKSLFWINHEVSWHHYFIPDICQVRLDFTDLELTAPGTTNGDCATDSLVIAPGATNTLAPSKPPTLCGTSTGQHGKYQYNWIISFKSIKIQITLIVFS